MSDHIENQQNSEGKGVRNLFVKWLRGMRR